MRITLQGLVEKKESYHFEYTHLRMLPVTLFLQPLSHFSTKSYGLSKTISWSGHTIGFCEKLES